MSLRLSPVFAPPIFSKALFARSATVSVGFGESHVSFFTTFTSTFSKALLAILATPSTLGLQHSHVGHVLQLGHGSCTT